MRKKELVVNVKNLAATIFITWGLWYVFFASSITLRPYYMILWPLLSIVGFTINLSSISGYIVKHKNIYILYGLFFIVCLCSLFLSKDKSASLDYIVKMLLGFLFVSPILSNKKQKEFVDIFSIYLVVMLILSFIQYLLPGFYTLNILPLIANNDSILIYGAIKNGNAIGLTGGTSINGCFMAMGFCLFWAKMISIEKCKIGNLIISILFAGMTFATGKRSYSLILIFVFLISLHYMKNNSDGVKKFLKYFGIIILSVGLFFIASRYIPAVNNFFEKFYLYNQLGDVSNGRFELYVDAWKGFKENCFIGIGINASNSVLGGAVHNSYLQWLVEFGLIGIVIPIIFVFYCPILYSKKFLSIWENDVSEYNRFVTLFSLFYVVLFLLAGLVATPFQWPNNFMVYMFCGFVISGYCRKEIVFHKEEVLDEYKIID